MSKSINIYLAIREKLFYEFFAEGLSGEDYRIVGTYLKDYPSTQEILKWKPDVVLLKLSKIADNPEVKFLGSEKDKLKYASIVTTNAAIKLPTLIKSGIQGLIHQNDGKEKMIECVEAVAEGQYYISRQATKSFLNETESVQQKVSSEWLQKLSTREIEILRKLVEHPANKEIADKLNISYKTVKNHRQNICDKLNLKGRGALLRFAMEHKKEFEA
jgi:DNA-binding NarL/FixJ family response regulator